MNATSSTIFTRITSRTWWLDAAKRAIYTAAAIALPYLGGVLLADIPWLTVASAAGVGIIASIATSLAGLPETEGVDLPWWLAAIERVVKTFFQALAAGIAPAVLFTDVDWPFILNAAALAAGVSLLRLILATLPANPTEHQFAVAELESFEAKGLAAEIAEAIAAQPRREVHVTVQNPRVARVDDAPVATTPEG